VNNTTLKSYLGVLLLLLVAAPALAQLELTAEQADTLLTVRSQPDYIATPPAPSAEDRTAQFDAVWEALGAEKTVRVIVRLDVPDYPMLRDLSIAATEANVSAAADAQLANVISDAVDVELAQLTVGTYEETLRYNFLPAVALEVTDQGLVELEASPTIAAIQVDYEVEPMLNHTAEIVEATSAWQTGLDGNGWYVAVLDTGIRASHEAFTGKDIRQACFSYPGVCPDGTGRDTTSPDAARHLPEPYYNDHGTHVAGIATGKDPAGTYDGIARGANIIAVQVFHPVDGPGNCDGADHCSTANTGDIVAAIDWLYSIRNDYQIASINLSLGGGRYYSQASCNLYNDFFRNAFALVRSVGIIPAAASGNDGWCDSLASPGCIDYAVAVGATNDDDEEAGFSNFHESMLDVYAPGVGVNAPVGDGDHAYGGKSGTSMATPHVAGALAILRQKLPDASAGQIIDGLETAGEPLASAHCDPSGTQKRLRIFNTLHAMLDTNTRWVDFAYGGPELGYWFAPYNTLLEGVTFTPEGDTLKIYSGSTSETMTISKDLRIETYGGPVRIGE
jgi:subtilisin family serine protease